MALAELRKQIQLARRELHLSPPGEDCAASALDQATAPEHFEMLDLVQLAMDAELDIIQANLDLNARRLAELASILESFKANECELREDLGSLETQPTEDSGGIRGSLQNALENHRTIRGTIEADLYQLEEQRHEMESKRDNLWRSGRYV